MNMTVEATANLLDKVLSQRPEETQPRGWNEAN